jgi:hypothetical protein
MNTYDSTCFNIGLCSYTAAIEYENDVDGAVLVHSCMIEVSAGDHEVWAKVDPEYFPAIEKQLARDLKEDAERENSKIVTPPDHNGDWPQMWRRQSS